MDFVDKHTAWSKQRLTSTRMERVSGYKVTDEFGKQTEQGYQSSITGITLKNDPERLRGTRGKLVLFEEGGKFPNLETAWRVEQPAVETDDGEAFGLIIFGMTEETILNVGSLFLHGATWKETMRMEIQSIWIKTEIA